MMTFMMDIIAKLYAVPHTCSYVDSYACLTRLLWLMAILMPTLIHANNTHMTSRYKKTKPKLGLFNSVELAIGLEPTTTGLQNQGSTIELRQHCTMHNIVFLFFLLLFFSKSLKFGKVPQFADNRCLK